MWCAIAKLNGPNIVSVRVVRDGHAGPGEILISKSMSRTLLRDALPAWSKGILTEESAKTLDRTSQDLTWTIKTEPYSTIAIHFRDIDVDDVLARTSSGPTGTVDIPYSQVEEPAVVILTIIADGCQIYRLETTLPQHDSFIKPALIREQR